MKDLRIEKPQPKVQDSKSANNSSDNTEISEKAQKGFKKGFQKEKRKQKNSSSGIIATEDNRNSNKAMTKCPKKDFFRITRYNLS